MKIICMIAAIVFPVMCAAEDSAKSDLPMAVRSVTTQRVGKSLIRVIEYNAEIDPKFSVELIKPPKMELLQKLDVKAIQIDVDGSRKLLNFNDTSGVFITGAAIDKGKGAVNFDVEFFGAGLSSRDIGG